MSARKILNISLPENLYDTISKMAEDDNKTKAEFAREVLREYITRRERWSLIRQWGTQTAADLNLTNESDLDNLIHESGQENNQ